jgi:hypothetical protein
MVKEEEEDEEEEEKAMRSFISDFFYKVSLSIQLC